MQATKSSTPASASLCWRRPKRREAHLIRILHDADDAALPTAHADGSALWLDREDVERATGWAEKPEGLCRYYTCMPLPPRAEPPMTDGDRLDVAALWRHAGWPVVHDDAAQIWVLGTGAAQSADACGCRLDLPVWQSLVQSTQGSTHESEFTVIAIALDQPEAARPWIEAAAPTYLCLIDRVAAVQNWAERGADSPYALDEARAQFDEATRLHPESWAMWRQGAGKEANGLAAGADFWARVDALGDRPYHRPVEIAAMPAPE